jgi:hypothetical protein
LPAGATAVVVVAAVAGFDDAFCFIGAGTLGARGVDVDEDEEADEEVTRLAPSSLKSFALPPPEYRIL